MIQRVNNTDAVEAIKRREPFENTGGTLRGYEGGAATFGYLPADPTDPTDPRPNYRRSVRDAVYVVFSYATPIGWELPNGAVVVPPFRYSPTTTQHQSIAVHGLTGGRYLSASEYWRDELGIPYDKVPRAVEPGKFRMPAGYYGVGG